jgi:hypothetical protein
VRVAYQRQFRNVTIVLDAEDAYARELGIHGRHPRPIGQVRFFVMGQMVAGVRKDFEEPLELLPVRNPSGYQLFFDSVRRPDGQVRQTEFPDGTYVLSVETPDTCFYQHMFRNDLVLPVARGATFAIDLLPGYGYPFPAPGTFRNGFGAGLVRGSFVNASGNGITGAVVSISPQPRIQIPGNPRTTRPWLFSQYLLDSTGQFVLVVPDSREYPAPQPGLPAGNTVSVRFTNGAVSTTVVGVPFILGGETTLQQTALRGTVLRRGLGVVNARVQVQGEPTAAVTRADGSWVYYFALNQPGLPPASVPRDITATLPDGSSLKVAAFAVQPRATSWVPAFRFL